MRNELLVIIEDSEADFIIYERLLSESANDFSGIMNIKEYEAAKNYLSKNIPKCCILDYHLPGGTAKDLIKSLYKKLVQLQFPIIVSTGVGHEKLAVELMQMGVQDYLVKQDLSAPELKRALRHAISAFDMQQKLRVLAHTDQLTGLLNRSLFMNRLEHGVKQCKRYGTELSLIYLDLDHFKLINDTYGHDVGDLVLQKVSERLKECVREVDSIARLGGDEFVIMLPNTKSHDGHFVVQKILQNIPRPIQFEGNTLQVYPSLGLASFPGTAKDSRELLKQADEALYKAKKQGRSQYVKFNQQEKMAWERRINLIAKLPNAIKNKQLRFAYQPVFSAKDEQCVFVEALVRWRYNDQDVNPMDIIHYVIQGDMLLTFHEYLFDTALKQLKAWQQDKPDLKMSINIPANVIHNQKIIQALYQKIDQLNICQKKLILEITETNLIRQPELTKQVLENLKGRGVQIAIDDFGTGYSSFEYISELPCSKLKIDKKFFSDWDKDFKNKAIAKATALLGHELNLIVIAEGIESEKMANAARDIGCDCIQGYWYAKPALAESSWFDFLNKARQASLAAQNEQ